MTAAEAQALIDQGVSILKQTTVGYANHSAAWQANPSTKWWQGLDKLAQARKALDAAPAPIPPAPTPTGIAPPRDPITRIADAPTVSLNIYGPGAVTKFSDYEITRGGETAVMVLPDAPGTILRRLKLIDVAAGWKTGMNKPHALYLKAPNATVEDIWASTSRFISGECFSLRYAGQILRRAHAEGPTFSAVVAYFQEKTNPYNAAADPTKYERGTVLIEDVDGMANGQTAIWIDRNTAADVEQHLIVRRCRLGAAGGAFIRAELANLARGTTVLIEACIDYMTGKPITAANLVTNIPASQLTIV